MRPRACSPPCWSCSTRRRRRSLMTSPTVMRSTAANASWNGDSDGQPAGCRLAARAARRAGSPSGWPFAPPSWTCTRPWPRSRPPWPHAKTSTRPPSGWTRPTCSRRSPRRSATTSAVSPRRPCGTWSGSALPIVGRTPAPRQPAASAGRGSRWTSADQAAVTADRLAEDLEIFSSPQFGYVRLHPSLCRASALMPQKRNPYALAVIRGGAGTLIGRTAGILATQRTPSARTDNWLYAYGEVLGAVGLGQRLVALAGEVVRTLEVDVGALAAGAGHGFTTATDLAEQIVLDQHLDYRSAYRLVARATALATSDGRSALTADDLAGAAQQVLGERRRFTPDLLSAMDPASVVAARTVPGGAAPERVREHATSIRLAATAGRAWARARRASAAEAEARLVAAAGETLAAR